jgi:hypothetical protein
MSLNPKDDIIAKFKRSNQGYIDNLSPEARQAFEELIDLCYPYLAAIMAKSEPFEDDPMQLTMMLVQQLIIKALKEEDSKADRFAEALRQVLSRVDNAEGELQAIRNIINEALTKKKAVEPPAEFQSRLEVK